MTILDTAKPSTVLSHPPHPFYPIEVELIGYLANDKSTLSLLLIFLAGLIVICTTSWCVVSKYYPRVRTVDKWALLWFMSTGTIHLFFEGYFSLNHTRMAPAQDLFGQMWKEYAYSDSRYLTSDPFVLCMETITAFAWGPLSYYVAYLITTQSSFRYPLQAVVSLGQIYGDVLYYATCMFDHYHKSLTYCRPEAYYFWFYFFFMNFIWIVIPGMLLYQSIWNTSEAFKALDRVSKTLQGNGAVKKPQANGHAKKHA